MDKTVSDERSEVGRGTDDEWRSVFDGPACIGIGIRVKTHPGPQAKYFS